MTSSREKVAPEIDSARDPVPPSESKPNVEPGPLGKLDLVLGLVASCMGTIPVYRHDQAASPAGDRARQMARTEQAPFSQRPRTGPDRRWRRLRCRGALTQDNNASQAEADAMAEKGGTQRWAS